MSKIVPESKIDKECGACYWWSEIQELTKKNEDGTLLRSFGECCCLASTHNGHIISHCHIDAFCDKFKAREDFDESDILNSELTITNCYTWKKLTGKCRKCGKEKELYLCFVQELSGKKLYFCRECIEKMQPASLDIGE